MFKSCTVVHVVYFSFGSLFVASIFFFTSRPFGVLPGMGIMVAALSGIAILTSLADRIDPRVFNCYILNPVDLIFTRICMLLSCSHLRSMRLKLGSGISFNGK